MAQNIGKRRGKSPTKVTLEQKRKAKREDPEGNKNFSKDLLGGALFALESAAYGPAGKAVKYGYKTVKKGVKKLTKTIPPERGPVPQGLKGGGDFDPEGKGYDYETAKKDHYFNIFRDAPGGAKPHGVSRDRKTGMLLKGRKHDTFSKGVGVDENLGYGLKKKGNRYYTEKLKRGIPAGEYKDMSKFSKGGCPHRENGVKSPIKGISGIQVKGHKFIGVK
jgi:hypothetical protein